MSLLVFLDKGFKSQPDVLMIPINLGYIAILNIHSVAYGCIINGIRKRKAMGLLNNGNLIDKSDVLKDINI